MTVPNRALFPMSGINIAFDREIIGPAMFSGLGSSRSGKTALSRHSTLEDIWCGFCCKIICDHLRYGIKTGLRYVWRKELGDPVANLEGDAKGAQWLEEVVPFFQTVRLPRSALTVEDCFVETGKQVKENLKNADPIFGEIGSMMEEWIKAWNNVYKSFLEEIFSLDDDCLPAKDPSGNLANALEHHLINLKTPSTPFFFNTLYDPYGKGSDFVRGYPFSLRQGVPCAISCGLWLNFPDYDAPTQIRKPEEKNTQYVDAVMTVPNGALFPMSGINIAFDREIIGPAMFSGLGSSRSGKTALSRHSTLEDIWCGFCCKIICDHLRYGIKTGLRYVWRKELGDPVANLEGDAKGAQWLEEVVPFFQTVCLPRSALTVEDCFVEIGKQVKENLKNADPIFGEIGSMMEERIKAWKSVSS